MADAGTISDKAPLENGRRRYPGVQPFHDSAIDRQLFRGRDDEKYDLFQLVLAERLVVLFARSGLGKSSLINAGLLEPLRDKGLFPMVVRVSGVGGPLDSLYRGIKREADTGIDQQQIEYGPDESGWNKTSLWHFFKTFEVWRNDKLLTPVLIIDQFEELFTLQSLASRSRLIDELADLVRGNRPRNVSEQNESDAQRLGDRPPEVKVVLSLREEFLANLEELAERIPAVLKARFRLNPLPREQARRALVEPAELKEQDLSTPAFSWAADARDSVLDFLCERQTGDGKTEMGDDVEPFQLQLVCQHVEDMVRDKGLATVTSKDLGGKQALKKILNEFYEDTLDKICDKFGKGRSLLDPKQWFADIRLRPRLQRLCEYGLITARGRRLLREESTIKESDKVSPEILREMVELRLIRREPRLGDNYYELTHDTLIEPILLSRQERDKKTRRWRRLRDFSLGLAVILLIGVAILIGWANQQGLTVSFGSSVLMAELGLYYTQPEMVEIPAGEFLMGSGDDDPDARSDEKPPREVKIKKPFLIGKYEVTFDEYDLFARLTERELPNDSGWGRGRRPVINVSWDDAVAYSEWLSEKTGKNYRLPTESEWEYVARAGKQTRYWWGDDIGQKNANCDGCGSRWDGVNTAPVGSFKPNPWGLYDTAGNVWEWTCSEYRDPYDGAEKSCTSKNDAKSEPRVIRGGSWFYGPRGLRSAGRVRYGRDGRFSALGFRLARSK